MTAPGPYSQDLDVLTALVTYLALTSRRSRTPSNLARDLALEPADVERVFRTFPGLFRRSRNTSEDGEHFFTLHARYALRDAQDDESLPEIGPELLRSLIDFVSRRADAEAAARFADRTLRQAERNTRVAAVAAVIAAVASVASAFIT